VLIIRVWIENEALAPRVRITSSLDLDRVKESRATTGIDDACAIVRSWLEEFIGRA
jgi:hypothetical protein